MVQIGEAVFSKNFFVASILLYVSGICSLISFASPYWSQSYPSTGNEFKNIGLWEACFYRYRHWKDDNQKPYTGCFWFWSPDMIRFRDWLMPGKLKKFQKKIKPIIFIVVILRLVYSCSIFRLFCLHIHLCRISFLIS
jgi:hypothetical protein